MLGQAWNSMGVSYAAGLPLHRRSYGFLGPLSPHVGESEKGNAWLLVDARV